MTSRLSGQRRSDLLKSLVLGVSQIPGGGRYVHEKPGSRTRTEEEYGFCVDFIVTTAVHLSTFDYDFDFGSRLTITPVES